MKRIIGVQQEIDGFYMDGEEGRAGSVYISTCGSILISVEGLGALSGSVRLESPSITSNSILFILALFRYNT
jgi:hypothetical protein